MAAKIISLSPDGVAAYATLPGSQGDLNRQAADQNDVVFGAEFNSSLPTTLSWQLNANAVYKGYAGYVGTIKKSGSATTMTDEACTLVSGKTYRITNATKQIIDRATAIVVKDNTVDQTANVQSFDPLFGTVTFKSSYTVTGAVTVSGKYLPTATIGTFRGYTLTMQAAAIDDSDCDTLQANGGYTMHSPGLRTVSLEVPGIYSASSAMPTLLSGRTELIIEINPDGLGASGSRARGYFKCTDNKISGNVGALENETSTFKLAVPLQNTGPSIDDPFAWNHHASSPIPTAIKTALTNWESGSEVFMKYLSDGTNGCSGSGVITNVSLTSSIEGLNTFSLAVQGSGATTAIP